MTTLRRCALGLLAAIVVAGSPFDEAEAFGRKAPSYPDGTVTAHSRIGNGSMTAEVRPAQRGGYEFRTPGRSWMPCEGDCELTLQNKVIDFWDNNANRTYPGRGITLFSGAY